MLAALKRSLVSASSNVQRQFCDVIDARKIARGAETEVRKYPMPRFELGEELPCRPDPPRSRIPQSLPDAFRWISLSCNIEQPLIGFASTFFRAAKDYYCKRRATSARKRSTKPKT